MRLRRRSAGANLGGSRVRAVPARSRVTVRRGPSLPHLATLAVALRQSRAALGRLQDELDAVLTSLRDPAATGDPAAAADRLRSAAKAAGLAFAGICRG
jgi:hypothetical protein